MTILLFLVAMGSMLWGFVGLLVGEGGLFWFGVLVLAASLGTMYLDLDHLGDAFGETEPLEWVIGSLLVYPGVVPIYIYQRLRFARRAA